jgi:hypothetical protein
MFDLDYIIVDGRLARAELFFRRDGELHVGQSRGAVVVIGNLLFSEEFVGKIAQRTSEGHSGLLG